MSSMYSNPPCAACKLLRRKCLLNCIFAPYFPPEEPTKFVNVHKIFGATNVRKLLSEIPPHQREEAVNSLSYKAEARLRDPVYGCVGAISALQRQLETLRKELEATDADLMHFSTSFDHNINNVPTYINIQQMMIARVLDGSFDQSPLEFPLQQHSNPWLDKNPTGAGGSF